MRHDQAREIAERLVREMRPSCERIEIAGSIRREKREVKDIELVVIPKVTELYAAPGGNARSTLFDVDPDPAPAQVNLLRRWAETQTSLQWIKAGKNPDPIPAPSAKAEGYWRAFVKGTEGQGEGGLCMKLDIFFAVPESWGNQFLLRTGSGLFNASWIEYMNRTTQYRARGGRIVSENQPDRPLVLREERDLFELLGLDYVSPAARRDYLAVQRQGRTVGRHVQI